MKTILIVVGLTTLFLMACQKHAIIPTPSVTTNEISNITPSTATSGGMISNVSLKYWGLCCSTKSNPTIEDIMVIDSTHLSNHFVMTISGLKGNTKYFLRAFVLNPYEVNYGNELSFTTMPVTLPLLNTAKPTNITSVTITTGGRLLNTGGSDITNLGVCWGISTNTDINDGNMSNVADTGSFISAISGLSPETTYYLRSYATNALGTGYGDEISFKTTSASSSVTDIDGNVYSSIKIGDQIWMQQNLKTTRYSNGDVIATTTPVSKDILDETNPNYQWAYNGKGQFVPLYGRLYTWYAVSDERNICPTGWHVASHAEWMSLMNYLVNNGYGSETELAKSIASNSGWNTSEASGTPGKDQAGNNNSGFSGLPAGIRGGRDSFQSEGDGAYWWSSTDNGDLAWDGCYIWHGYGRVYNGGRGKYQGLSVRCIKD